MKNNNDTEKLPSPDIRKIPSDSTRILNKNDNKYRLQILETICIKIKF